MFVSTVTSVLQIISPSPSPSPLPPPSWGAANVELKSPLLSVRPGGLGGLAFTSVFTWVVTEASDLSKVPPFTSGLGHWKTGALHALPAARNCALLIIPPPPIAVHSISFSPVLFKHRNRSVLRTVSLTFTCDLMNFIPHDVTFASERALNVISP